MSVKILPFTVLLFLFGCQVHQACEDPIVPVIAPSEFSTKINSNYEPNCPWWENFNDPQLSLLINQALECNLRLDIAWQRLEQARAATEISESALFPEINLSAGYRYSNSLNRCTDSKRHSYENWSIGPSLSYQVDLWGRIHNQVKSQVFTEAATYEDFLATQLLISGEVTEAWLTLQELYSLNTLLEHQLELAKQQLSHIEHRFTLGQASSLQVYQQRQQLKRTELQIPATRRSIETTTHRLNIILGQAPTTPICACSDLGLPELAPLESLGTPCSLLSNRPDLKSAMNRVIAADYDVGVAVAERFPRMDLSLSYGFNGAGISHFFDQEAGSAIANLMAPIFDYGRRKNQVLARRAAACQAVQSLGNAFLNAMGEVEDGLSTEKYQLEYLSSLKEQLSISEKNLKEATTRYQAGLTEYLDVVSAIQTLETVQREMISAQKNLLSNRARLYQALGGPLHCNIKEKDILS